MTNHILWYCILSGRLVQEHTVDSIYAASSRLCGLIEGQFSGIQRDKCYKSMFTRFKLIQSSPGCMCMKLRSCVIDKKLTLQLKQLQFTNKFCILLTLIDRLATLVLHQKLSKLKISQIAQFRTVITKTNPYPMPVPKYQYCSKLIKLYWRWFLINTKYLSWPMCDSLHLERC